MAAYHLLVIEDDPTWALLLAERLRPHYRVSAAVDGPAALAALQGLGPAAIILDLHLGTADGRQVLAALRAAPAGRQIPVVVYSSSAADAQLQAELGRLSTTAPAVFIAKSAPFAALLAAVRQVLGQDAARIDRR